MIYLYLYLDRDLNSDGWIQSPKRKPLHHKTLLPIDFISRIIACNDYYTQKEQPDIIPDYSKLCRTSLRMDNYFRDCQIFWKLESMIRFGYTDEMLKIIDKYDSKFQSIDSSTFFQYALDKLAKYNSKKNVDQKHLNRYFKNDII